VISDPDIFRAAKLLIDQHGEDAAIWAARISSSKAGNVDGVAVELTRGR